MSEENAAPDLFDLKFLPAWVKETPNENPYADFAGEENAAPGMRDRPRGRDQRDPGRRDRGPHTSRGKEERRDPRDRNRRSNAERAPQASRPQEPMAPVPAVEARFVPDSRVLESVLGQIKAGHLTYSVFSLGRMFLDKPERYNVMLKAESALLFQLGENGPVASDQRVLENGAFLSEKDNFYRAEVTQSEPIKGNFTSIARCRLSGVLLGPTNHHAYQPQLRNLYEQRFSRRMSFPDYQRQIEILTDPEAVERWKEEARSVTTYVTLQEETPQTFNTAAETERHFRQTYLPGLLRNSAEVTLDGVVSRRLSDRSLGRLIENSWAQEYRSPSKMMQELIGAFRQSALHIFRHRKGMLFVSPVRARPFHHDSSSVSANVAAILETLAKNPGINRKQLLENLPHDEAADPGGGEKKKLALASDLHWLISEGHVIEFNDGALDLARNKQPPMQGAVAEPNGHRSHGAEESVRSTTLPDSSGENVAETKSQEALEPPTEVKPAEGSGEETAASESSAEPSGQEEGNQIPAPGENIPAET